MEETVDIQNDTKEEVLNHYREVIDDVKACNQELINYPGAVPHYEVSIKLPESGVEVDLEIRNFDEALDVESPFQFIVADFDENMTDAVLELSYEDIGNWVKDKLGENTYQNGLTPVIDPDAEETRLTMSIQSGDIIYSKDLAENIMKEIDRLYADSSY